MVKEDIKEFFICQNSVFYGKYENEKKTGQKKFDLPQRGFEPPIFEQVPAPKFELVTCQALKHFYNAHNIQIEV